MVLATLIVAIVAQYAGVIVFHVVEQRYDASQFTLILGARETVALIVAGFLAKRYLGASWRDLGLRRLGWRQVVLGASIGLALTALEIALMLATGMRGGSEVDVILRATAWGSPGWRTALFGLVALYSPVVQEIIFRGLLLQGLLQRTNVVVALAVSSGIFAVLHAGGGAFSVADTFVFGALQGALFIRFRSLTAPIASHVAVNSFAMAQVLWALQQAGR